MSDFAPNAKKKKVCVSRRYDDTAAAAVGICVSSHQMCASTPRREVGQQQPGHCYWSASLCVVRSDALAVTFNAWPQSVTVPQLAAVL